METQDQHTDLTQALKAQVEFLNAQVVVYESTELGRQRLRDLIQVLERVAEALANGKGQAAVAAAAAAPSEVTGPPSDPEDLDGWLAFLLIAPTNEDALTYVELLREKAQAAGEWDKVVDVHLARVEITTKVEERVKILVEVARIYEQQIGDLAKAFTAMAAACRESPLDEHLRAEVERYASATEQWGELVAFLNELAPSLKDPKVAAVVWLKLSRVYHERLERPDYAVASLWHCLEKDPGCAEAWDELASIYKRKEQWFDLVHVLRKRLDATKDKQERVFFLLELADLYDSRLGNPTEARLLYEEVRAIDPANVDASASLEAILRRLELWEPLVSLLMYKADHAEESEVKWQARWEVGLLMRDHLEDPGSAVGQFEKLMDEDADNLDLLRALYDLYEELERTKDFLRVAERRAQLVQDDGLRNQIYRRMAVEMQADPLLRNKAADVLEKILDVDPEGEQTYRDLERIYIQTEAWDELVATYRRHANIAQSTPVKTEVLRAMSAVLDEKLGDAKAAADGLKETLLVDAEDLQALTYLSALQERLEQWVELVEVLSRRAEITHDEHERVDLHRRIGEITLSKLGAPEEAEKRLMKALELDPANGGVMMALVELYKGRKEWLRAANMLADAERVTANRMEKARLLFEAGEIQHQHLENLDKAVDCYAKAMLVDPEHQGAATFLAAHHFEQQRWDEAEPLLDLLLRKVDDKDRRKKLELHTRLGLAAKHLKRAEKAVKHLEIARELDPTSLEVLRELADLKFHLEKWPDVANLYQAILVAHRDALPKPELVAVYHRLGSVKLELGEKDKALNLFEKALELDPTYQPSVHAVLRIREEAEDYDRVVATKKMMMDKTVDVGEKHRLAVEIGHAYQEKLHLPDKAIEFYEKALELQADDRGTLHQLLEIHTAAEDWTRGAKVVLRLGDLENRPTAKIKYLHTAALIYRDELEDSEAALAAFEKVLDIDHTHVAAFEAIDRLHSEKEDWKELARAIRRQLKRLPETGSPAGRIALLDRLGGIYQDHLQEPETALAAFEAADALDPSNTGRKTTLAKLYLSAGPDKLDKAIEQHHALLRQNPYKVQLFKDLTELYIRTKRKDETFCMCQALNFLGKASDKEKIFYERYRKPELTLAQRKLTEAQWRDLLRHPTESAKIDGIFAALCSVVALQSAQPHKKFGLKRQERLVPEEDGRPVAKLFVYASRVLDVQPRPEVFVRADQPQPIQVANATERASLLPTWLVDADKFASRPEREVVFDVARELTFMRPDRYLWRALVSQTDLFNVLYAALSIMVPDAPVPGDSPDVKKLAAYLKKAVPPLVFEQLLPTAKELLAGGKDETNVAHWITATQRTALRAAMLLTNDFATVAKVVATESDNVTGLAAKERVADLLVFSVSPEHFQLRKHLGFALE
jgi:tetratricopeptide (TPR) repeat protein